MPGMDGNSVNNNEQNNKPNNSPSEIDLDFLINGNRSNNDNNVPNSNQAENNGEGVKDNSVSDYDKEIERLKEEYVGNILDDRYEILEVVGKGGMACVLKAHDMTMNRAVAIKILNSELNEDDSAVERFKNESQAIAMMSHKNIVTVYDVVFHQDMKYIIMEYLSGITFEKYLAKKEKLPWKEACYFMYKVLVALEHSHGKKIIHSDVKPQNLMVERNGEIILTDFGIAKIPSDISGSKEVSKEALGTAYYMSPEQASGKEVCVQSDIYSVGVILYEAVAGKLPFEGDDPYDVMEKQISQVAISPASYTDDIPDGLVQIITKAMRKNADERYPSAREMADAIEEIVKNPTKTFDGIEIPAITLVDDTKKKELKKKNKAAQRKKKREERKEAKLSSPVSRSFFPIITGVALAFIIVIEAVIGYALWEVIKKIDFASTLESLFYADNDVQVTMPNLVGKNWENILEQIQGDGLKDNKGNTIIIDPSGIRSEFNSEYEYGQVIQQIPEANMQTKDNRITTLIISLGSERHFMPDVVHMSRREAETTLKRVLGDDYKVSFVPMKHEYANYEQVIKTEPEAGQLVNQTDSGYHVIVYYCESENPTEIRMPNLVGLSYEEAKRIIEDNNLILGKITTEQSLSAATVLKQSIAPYEAVMPYSTVIDLVISEQVESAPMLDVVGKNKDEAKKLLNQYGITQIRFENVYTSKEDDIIVSQNVEKGEMISKDTLIVLSVNVHADTTVMPLLVGKTAEEADIILNENNISGSDIVWEDLQSFYPQGMVIAQSVAPGEEIVKGSKTIKLTKSVEVESLRITKLTGMTLEEATNWLQIRGISFKVRDQVDQNAENGVIVSQSVPMFSEISRGQEVIIYKNVYVAFDTESSEETN